MEQIAFISLGHMGAPMAINLLEAGYLLNVFDLVQNTVDGLVAAGASAARSVRDAMQGADVVISMLPAGQHVENLYLGDDGLLAYIVPGTLVLKYSTIALTSACEVHVVVRERGPVMFDAPVSGNTASAATDTPTFVVGGDAEALEETRPLFEAMGRNIFHADPDGAGQIAKVCNNQLLVVLMIDTAEAMALGVVNGLRAKVLAETMYHGSGNNWALEAHNPWSGAMEDAPASRNCNGGFMTQLMIKDLGLTQEAARASTSNTPMGSLALSLCHLLLKQGYTEWDSSMVQKSFDLTQGQQTDRRVRAQAD